MVRYGEWRMRSSTDGVGTDVLRAIAMAPRMCFGEGIVVSLMQRASFQKKRLHCCFVRAVNVCLDHRCANTCSKTVLCSAVDHTF